MLVKYNFIKKVKLIRYLDKVSFDFCCLKFYNRKERYDGIKKDKLGGCI